VIRAAKGIDARASLIEKRVTSEATLEIYCKLALPDGVLYIDNIKLEPKAD
jgi:hypothetical protein